MHCSGAGRRPESKHLKREQQWMIVVTLLGGEKVILLPSVLVALEIMEGGKCG